MRKVILALGRSKPLKNSPGKRKTKTKRKDRFTFKREKSLTTPERLRAQELPRGGQWKVDFSLTAKFFLVSGRRGYWSLLSQAIFQTQFTVDSRSFLSFFFVFCLQVSDFWPPLSYPRSSWIFYFLPLFICALKKRKTNKFTFYDE